VSYLNPNASAAEPTTNCLVSDFIAKSGIHDAPLAIAVMAIAPNRMNIAPPPRVANKAISAKAPTIKAVPMVRLRAFEIVALRSASRAARAGSNVSDQVLVAFLNSGLCDAIPEKMASINASDILFPLLD